MDALQRILFILEKWRQSVQPWRKKGEYKNRLGVFAPICRE